MPANTLPAFITLMIYQVAQLSLGRSILLMKYRVQTELLALDASGLSASARCLKQLSEAVKGSQRNQVKIDHL